MCPREALAFRLDDGAGSGSANAERARVSCRSQARAGVVREVPTARWAPGAEEDRAGLDGAGPPASRRPRLTILSHLGGHGYVAREATFATARRLTACPTACSLRGYRVAGRAPPFTRGSDNEHGAGGRLPACPSGPHLSAGLGHARASPRYGSPSPERMAAGTRISGTVVGSGLASGFRSRAGTGR
jgi:hypothetical protein